MKRCKSYILAFTSLLGFCTSTWSQDNNPALVSFIGIQHHDSILLSFTIRSGYTCNGVGIHRSTDSVNFSAIGKIGGICGNSSEDVPYQFTDKLPEPSRINYYRLDLGAYGYSQVIKIYFRLTGTGYPVYPNPCKNGCTLYFENPYSEKFDFLLYHTSGRLVSRKTVDGNQLEIGTQTLPAGLYYYQLINKERILNSGKLFIP